MTRRGIVATVKLKRTKKTTSYSKLRKSLPTIGAATGYIAGGLANRFIAAPIPTHMKIMGATVGGGIIAGYSINSLINRHRRIQRVTKIRMEMGRQRKIKMVKKRIQKIKRF